MSKSRPGPSSYQTSTTHVELEQPTSAAPPIVVVSSSLLVDNPHPCSSVSVVSPEEFQDSFKSTKKTMRPWISSYHCSFHEVLIMNQSLTSISITERVQLVLTDPPYNILRAGNTGEILHDCLTPEDVPDILEVVDNTVCNRGHAILFCAAEQFPALKRVFCLWERANRFQQQSFHGF